MPGDAGTAVDFGTSVDVKALGPERRFGGVAGADRGIGTVLDVEFADPGVLAASRDEWSGAGGHGGIRQGRDV